MPGPRAEQERIGRDPQFAAAYTNFGIEYGDLARAEQSARRAVEQSPENAWAHLLLGDLLWENKSSRGDRRRHIEFAARSVAEAQDLLQSFECLQ